MMKRGTLLLGLLVASIGALGGASWATIQQAAPLSKPDEMPTEAPKLFEWAQNKMNQGLWKDADRGFKAYLEQFAQGEQAESAHQMLGNLHQWYSHRYAESRDWYARLCEKFPKSPNYWHYRIQMAQTWQSQNLRDRAIEEYLKIAKEAPDANVRAQAIQQSWQIKGKYFYMHVNGTFTAGQSPEVNVQLHNVDKVVYRAVHIPFAQVQKALGDPDGLNFQNAIAKVPAEGRTVLKEWTVEYTYDRNQWKNESLKVPSTEAGVYIVEGEHEGVTMTVTLFSTKFGIVTKSAAGKLVCFAQDRATSRPVADMEIRVLSKEHPLTGKTGPDGLWVAQGYHGGVIAGFMDGEIVSTESHYTERLGAHPLLYFTTDRPIYRPHQTVQFRLVHRWEEGDLLSVQPGQPLVLEIRDPKGNKVYEEKHTLSPFGTTTGRFVLGDEPPLGEYTIVAHPGKRDADYNEWQWQHLYYGNRYQENFGKFRVDEYRKPEYKVDVEFKKSPVLQGDTVEATVNAQYYFGSPVTEADVTYTVYRRGHWWHWRSWAYYYDWYSDEDEAGFAGGGKRMARWWGYGEQVLQGSGKTDREGHLKVVFPAQKWEYDAVYTVAAQVTDLSRRVVEGQGAVKATRAEFGLGMTLNKYVYKPGDRINAKIRATTADDRPVADTKITLRAYDRHWQTDKYDDHLLFEAETRTDAHGIAEVDYTPDREGGYLWLVAEARDRKDNRVTAEHYAWLCGNAWAGDHVNLNGVDLILDKKTYDVGDTAEILVTSQFKNVSLLFTVEGKEIYHQEVVPVKGHTRTIPLKLDRAHYAPNVFVTVSAIKENQVVQRQKMIVVNPSRKFVTVEIKPDKAQYRPREKARYEVTTLDSEGRPVAAEVALGIVDESIYALQDEYANDVRKFFIHRKGIEVAMSSSLYYYDWGRADRKEARQAAGQGGGFGAKRALDAAAAPMAAMQEQSAGKPGGLRDADKAEKGKNGKDEAFAATEIRSRFADTMLWTTAATGADGKAVVEVEIPDNLTAWRATARAVTADSRFGQEARSVVSRKNVIVRLETPRFFTQNDETVISAIAHNYLGGEKEMKVEFEAEGIEIQGDRTVRITVAPEGQKRLDWKARVRKAGRAKITVKVLSDEDSDAMELAIPVLPHGTMKWDSKGGVVDGKVVERIQIPAGAVKGGSELVVVVSPTHASMVLDALEYLAGYPYGCVEQTMSRFLPTVVVSQTLQKLGIRNPELQAEIPAMVAAGLQRLYNFQHADGGWGWWQHDQSNPWITAYVVLGLAMARDADHGGDPAVLTRGLAAARSHLSQNAKDPNLQAYLLYSLSVAGVRDDAVRDGLAERMAELSDYSKALLALVLSKDGRDASAVVRLLAQDAKVTGGAAHFEGGNAGGWMDHPMEVTAAALRAFLKVDPRNELVPKLVNWLGVVRQGNYWASTRQTAMVVFAMSEYIALTGEMEPDMTLALTVNGERIFSEHVTKENWQKFQGTRKFPADKLRDGENVIEIERTGNGRPSYSVYAKYYAEAEDLKPSEGGIKVDRIYSRVIRENGKRILQRLESGDTVTSGEEVEVTLNVEADRNYEWLMLEDPLPSGFEPIREYWGFYGWRWNYWYSRKEFHDQKVSIAMTTLWQGRHTATYVMRAETPGDFHVLPAGVWNMYTPTIGGNSA
ncbi:MAG TPA: MG2 domain-containing protein, partial [Planctomycetota bacterium]|nr:MG2 domain-containing protein [Planctomycetota bacterium]